MSVSLMYFRKIVHHNQNPNPISYAISNIVNAAASGPLNHKRLPGNHVNDTYEYRLTSQTKYKTNASSVRISSAPLHFRVFNFITHRIAAEEKKTPKDVLMQGNMFPLDKITYHSKGVSTRRCAIG